MPITQRPSTYPSAVRPRVNGYSPGASGPYQGASGTRPEVDERVLSAGAGGSAAAQRCSSAFADSVVAASIIGRLPVAVAQVGCSTDQKEIDSRCCNRSRPA